MNPSNRTRHIRYASRSIFGPALIALLVLLAAVGCASSGGRSDSGSTGNQATPSSKSAAPAANASGTRDQNACHLLAPDEVSQLTEEKIVMRDQTEAGDTWSTCSYEDGNGVTWFSFTVYWTGGKEEWETWRLAQGAGSQVLKQAEGVGPNDIVKQGQVAGVGDAAYFSRLLPSLVLKGDVLIELNLAVVPDADKKFVGLAKKLLAKI